MIRRATERDYDKFYYRDVHRCQYRTKTGRINLYGIYEGTYYKYQKDGALEAEPYYHRSTDSIASFYTVYEPEVDFVAEIEGHTPLKVEISDT